jgi:hypothetical protein
LLCVAFTVHAAQDRSSEERSHAGEESEWHKLCYSEHDIFLLVLTQCG